MQNELKYQIELKKVKIFLPGSQETINFVADVYVDGKCIGVANNQGHGGMTFIQGMDEKGNFSIKNAEKIHEIEQYFLSLPKEESRIDGIDEVFMHQPTFDEYIDELIGIEADKKEKVKFAKKLQKDCEQGICYGTERGYAMTYWNDRRTKGKKLQIAEMLTMPNGKELIMKAVAKIESELKDGERILNTNLPCLSLA